MSIVDESAEDNANVDNDKPDGFFVLSRFDDLKTIRSDRSCARSLE
jgi:hypothetical protein